MRDEDLVVFKKLWPRAIKLQKAEFCWTGSPGNLETEARLLIYPHGWSLSPLRPRFARATVLLRTGEDLAMIHLPRIPYEELMRSLDDST